MNDSNKFTVKSSGTVAYITEMGNVGLQAELLCPEEAIALAKWILENVKND